MASFKGLSYNEYRFLAGNGIRVPVFAAWFLFTLGYNRRREVPTVAKSLAIGDEQLLMQRGDAHPRFRGSREASPLWWLPSRA